MNKIIKRELEKVRVELPDYDDNTTSIFIPKSVKNDIVIGSNYLIKVKSYIINEPPGFTLSTNWNNGVTPKEQFLSGTLVNVMGKMYQFNCNGYNFSTKEIIDSSKYIGLWLPKESFEVVQ